MADSYLQDLLPELILEMAEYLDATEVGDLRCTCQRMDTLLSPYFRKTFFKKDLDFLITDEVAMTTLEQISASPIYKSKALRPESLNFNMARLEHETQWRRVSMGNDRYEQLRQRSGRPPVLPPVCTAEPSPALRKRAFVREGEKQEWFVFGGGLAIVLRRIFNNFMSSGIRLKITTMTCTAPEWHETRGLARLKRICGTHCLDRSDNQQDVYEILMQALIDTGYYLEGLSLGSQWGSKVSLEMFSLFSSPTNFAGLRTFTLQVLPRFYKPYDNDEELQCTAMRNLDALETLLRGLHQLESLSLNMTFLGSNIAADQRLEGVRPLQHLLETWNKYPEPQFPALRHLSLARGLISKSTLLTFVGYHAAKLQSLDLLAIEDDEQTHPDFADELYAVAPSEDFALHMSFVYGCPPSAEEPLGKDPDSPLEGRIDESVATELT